MSWRVALLILVAFGLRSPWLAAQTLTDAESQLARGDTARAIKILEQLAKRAPQAGEARYRVAQLYLARSTVGRDTILNRRRAIARFQEAVALEPTNVEYWLALASVPPLKYLQCRLPLSTPIPAAVSRAPKSSEQAQRWHRLATLAYRSGWTNWSRHSLRGHRYVRRGSVGDARNPVNPVAWKPVQSFLDDTVRAPWDDYNWWLADAMADLRATVDIEPHNLDAAGLLAIMIGTGGGWRDAVAFTRTLVAAEPGNGQAWALHGMALARLGQWRDAAAAFETAFTRMTRAERAPFRDLGYLLDWEEERRFHALSAPERERFAAGYWESARPLAITDVNEARTEFYARIVYAQHAWGDPWSGVSGLETDAGIIYVRYGVPDFAGSNTWIYTRPRLVFSVGWRSGWRQPTYAVHGMEAYRVARIHFPASFEDVPVVRTLDTVLVQTARFRGPADSLAVMIVGAIPLRRMAQAVRVRDVTLVSGALVTDSGGLEVSRDRVKETVTGARAREVQYRSWRLTLEPGAYMLRVEAALPVLERGARAMGKMDLAPLGGPGLALSDLLVANRVAPRDSVATRWSDFFIEPNAGRFAPGDPVDLLWELYNLAPDSSGTTHYSVEIRVRVEAIERHVWYMRILGTIGDLTGLSAVGGDQVSLQYERAERETPEGIRTEFLTVDLKDAPAGRYYFEIVVHDAVSGNDAITAREITVGTGPVLPSPPWKRIW